MGPHNKGPPPAPTHPEEVVQAQARCPDTARQGRSELTHRASTQAPARHDTWEQLEEGDGGARARRLRVPHLLCSFRQHSGSMMKVYRFRKSSRGSVPAELLA